METIDPQRYVKTHSGLFVLLCLLLGGGAITISGYVQGWLEPMTEYRIVLPVSSLGMRPGNSVMILGTQAGYVNRIKVSDDGRIEASIRVQTQYARFVRKDSQATIKMEFVMVGEAYISISGGQGDQLPPHGELTASPPTDLAARAEQVLASLHDPEGDMRTVLAGVVQISDDLQKGKGVAGMLLKDEKFADQLRALVAKTDATLTDLQTTNREVRTLAGQLCERLQLPGETPLDMLVRLVNLLEVIPGNVLKISEGTYAVAARLDKQIPPMTQQMDELQKAMNKTQATLADMEVTARKFPHFLDRLHTEFADLPDLIMEAQQAITSATRVMDTLNNVLGGNSRQENKTIRRLSPAEAAGGQP